MIIDRDIYKKNNILPLPSTLEPSGPSYAGIGSRGTPGDIGKIMISAGYYLARAGLVLRSGGAPGADQFFEIGADLAITVDPTCQKQVFLPRNDFFGTGNSSVWTFEDASPDLKMDIELIAGRFHQGWLGLDYTSKQLMSRNVNQVLGVDLKDPVEFVLCWTKDGCISHEERSRITGGTGQALSIADSKGVDIWNLQRDDHRERVLTKLNSLKQEFGEIPPFSSLPKRYKTDYNNRKKMSY